MALALIFLAIKVSGLSFQRDASYRLYAYFDNIALKNRNQK